MTINHRRISLSIASGFLLEAINKISPILILHHAQKTLGLVDFGAAQYQIAFYETIQPLVTYGFANFALADDASKSNDSERLSSLFTHIFALKSLNAILVLLFFLFSSSFSWQSTSSQSSLLILGLVLLCSVFDAYWYCITKHKLAIVGLISGLLRLLSLFSIILFVDGKSDSQLFVLLSLLPNLIVALGTGVYSYAQTKFSPINLGQLSKIFMRSSPFALVVLLIVLFDRVDLFLVEYWFGLEMAGVYAGPAKVVQSVSLLTASMALPFYAEMIKIDDQDSIYKHTSLSLWALSTVVSPFLFGIWFVEQDIASLLFTQSLPSGHYLMSILSIGMIGSILVSAFGLQILLSKARPWTFVLCLLISLVSLFSLSFMIKDVFGFRALAYSQVCGRILLGLLCMWFAKEFVSHLPWKSLLKPMLAGACMAITLRVFAFENIFYIVVVGAIAYAIALLLINLKEFGLILRHPSVRSFLNKKMNWKI